MRVLLVSPCFGAYGGIEAFVFAVADAVGQDPRFDVRVCFKRVANFSLQPALEQYCQGARVEFCDRVSRELWAAIGWADVVHAQNASPDVAMMAALQRKPLAISVHNVLPDSPVHRRMSWQFSARLATARWFNSDFVWKSWETTAPRLGSVRIPPQSPSLEKTATSGTRKGFVFLGRLIAGKGIDILIAAYQQAHLDPVEWPLTIFGEGPMRVDLERSCRGQPSVGVCFAGFIEGEAKRRALAACKWLVAPSNWGEPFGLVAVEARSQGVPCIITRDGGLPEAAGRDALVCEPGDVAGLSQALRQAAAMTASEYEARSTRTREDLATELVPMSFYSEAYLRLCAGSERPNGQS